MTPLEQAQEILSMDPLPDDAEARIEELERQASDEEKLLFPSLWEALAVIQNE